MGGGGGFMYDANKKMAQNRALLKKSRVFNINNTFLKADKVYEKLKAKDLSEKDKVRIHKMLKRREHQNRIRFLKVAFMSILGGFGLAWVLWSWMQI